VEAKVHLAIHESTLRIFTRLRYTASAGDKGLQDLLLDIHRAVAGDFHRIFPRERMGGTENSGDHLIYGFVIVTDDGTIR
jgi:hypothetical protein